jgi:hypothetical protein
MNQVDMKPLLAEVAKRHGFRLDSDDPGIAIVTLNQLILEVCMEQLCEAARTAVGEIERTGKKAETRAVAYIAQEVRPCVAAIREELQKDIDTARLRARETVVELNRVHRQMAPLRERWIGIGLIIGIALIAFGFWAGYIAR